MTMRRLAVYARRLGRAIAQYGYNPHYELGFADELLAIFAGFTIALAVSNDWVAANPRAVATFVVATAATSALIITAINQKQMTWRMAFNLLALLASWLGVRAIDVVTLHDLKPQAAQLWALPLGVLVWILVREASVILLNTIARRSA